MRSPALALIYAGLMVALVAGYLNTWPSASAQPAFFQTQNDLARRLEAAGETRVYSEFWTCYRLIFLSDERVVCSVLNPDLSQRPSRWAPYDALVAATPGAAYVFPLRTRQAVNLLAGAHQQGWRVSVTFVDNLYGIFRVTPPGG